MPQPERRSGGESPPDSERLPRDHLAARFAGEGPAGTVYFAAQEAVFVRAGDVDPSAYRFQIDRVYHVAVLGNPPPTELHDQLRALLAFGEPATVPDEALRLLNAHRIEATKRGPWVQRHHRPGEQLA